MWSKIKEALKGLWDIVFISMGVIVLGLLHYVRSKKDEVASLKAKDKLNEADKQSSLLDKEIDQKKKENSLSQDKIKEIDTELAEIEEKQKTSKELEASRPEDEVEEYWNKK